MPMFAFSQDNFHNYASSIHSAFLTGLILPLAVIASTPGFGLAENASAPAGKFVGTDTCATAGCHGGADPKRYQYQYWQHADPHSKAFATLTTARSARMAEDLKLGEAAANIRCTACHAPFQGLPDNLKLESVKAQHGVACESCHGAAGNWVLAHTREDYSHAQRVKAGMRDLQSLYTRAGSCVACHQALDSDILKAGHPELMFEMDGQTVAQPRHWQESPTYNGAQAWLVGQAVALREMSWQLQREHKPLESVVQRWQALKWLLQQTRDVMPMADHLVSLPDAPEKKMLVEVQHIADQLAKAAADMEWSDEQTRKVLKRMAASATYFDGKSSKALAGRRAERLVLALDRLTAALPAAEVKPLDGDIKKLFAGAQVLQDFAPASFAQDLNELARKL